MQMFLGPICKHINRNVTPTLYKTVDELGQTFAVSVITPFQIEDWKRTNSIEFKIRVTEVFR